MKNPKLTLLESSNEGYAALFSYEVPYNFLKLEKTWVGCKKAPPQPFTRRCCTWTGPSAGTNEWRI
jgi:hypothetical protein